MYRSRSIFLFLLLAVSLSLACGRSQTVATVPTAIPTVFAPTATKTVAPSATPQLATATLQPTPVRPTRMPTRTPTPVIAPILTMMEPAENSALVLGSEAVVSGFGQVGEGMSIKVGLSSLSGWSLSAVDAVVEESTWHASLPIPEYVTGSGQVHAVILDAGGNELARKSVPVTLNADQENNQSYLTMYRPTANMVAVAGHNFFVDGQLWKSGGGNMQIEVRMNDCKEEVTDFSFTLSSSSYWYGLLVLPRDIAGPACVVASVGEPGDDGWRASQVPVTVLHQDDENAKGITITNPRGGIRLRGGEPMTIGGIAYNVAGELVNIDLSLTTGQVVAETTAEVDRFGHWNVELPVPGDVEGEAIIRATVGEEALPDAEVEIQQAEVELELLPASP